MKSQWIIFYDAPCTGCGNKAPVRSQQAGSVIKCPACDSAIKVAPLTRLIESHREPRIETPNSGFQFRLSTLLLLFIPAALFSFIMKHIGVAVGIALLIFGGGYVATVYCIAKFPNWLRWIWDRVAPLNGHRRD